MLFTDLYIVLIGSLLAKAYQMCCTTVDDYVIFCMFTPFKNIDYLLEDSKKMIKTKLWYCQVFEEKLATVKMSVLSRSISSTQQLSPLSTA